MLAESATLNVLAICIATEHRDGMSWSATKAFQTIEKILPGNWDVRCVGNPSDSERGALGELSDLLSDSKVVRLAARKAGLVPDLGGSVKWRIGVAALAVVAAVAITLLTRLMTHADPRLLAGVGVVTVAAVLGLVNDLLKASLPAIMPASTADAKIASALAQPRSESNAERAFRAILLKHMVPRQLRAVVIDDYGRLNGRTRDLVSGYLEDQEQRKRPELWIIFERGNRNRRSGLHGREPFNAKLLGEISPGTHVWLWRGRQMTLTPAEREEMLWALERRQPRRNDSRLNKRLIAEVADKQGADECELVQELDRELMGQSDAVRRAFTLLTVGSAAGAGAYLSSERLISLTQLDAESSVSTRLLELWFPADANTHLQIEQAIVQAPKRLVQFFEDTEAKPSSSRLRVSQPYVDAMLSSQGWREHGEPSQDLGRAFWALYWHSELRGASRGQAAEQLIVQLRSIDDPPCICRELGGTFANAMFDAAVDAIEACFELGLGGLVSAANTGDAMAWDLAPGLLKQARLFLDRSSETYDKDCVERLLVTAWSSYMLTGEREILEMIQAVTGEAQLEAESESDSPLLQIYLLTLPRAFAGPLAWPSNSADSQAIRDHAAARAGWLTVILKTALQSDQTPLLSRASADSQDQLRKVYERIEGRRALGQSTTVDALDCLSLSYILLADIFTVSRTKQESTVDDEVSQDLDSTGVALPPQMRIGHFLFDGLARHLLACETVYEEVSSSSHRRTSFDRAIGDLDALHLMWHNFEFYELADAAALSRNLLRYVLEAENDARDLEHAAGYLLGIGVGPRHNVYRSEIEFVVGAARERTSFSGAALAMTAGATAMVEARVSSTLTLELCLMALRFGVIEEYERLETLLRYVLGTADGSARIMAVSDEALPRRLASLLNATKDMDAAKNTGLWEAFLNRSRQVVSPWIVDEADQQVEIFRAKQAKQAPEIENLLTLVDTWRARVWRGGPALCSGYAGTRSESYEFETRLNYAFFLSDLWPNLSESQVELVTEDAARLLAECDSSSAQKGFVYLALRVVSRLEEVVGPHLRPTQQTSTILAPTHSSTTQGVGVATVDEHSLDLLRRALQVEHGGIETLDYLFKPVNASTIYSQLARGFPDERGHFSDRAEYWRAQDERLNEERLIHDVIGGRTFEVFWHHYERLFELPLDLDRAAVEARLASPPSATSLRRMQIPEPLIFGIDGRPTSVCAEFLCIGHWLLHAQSGSPIHAPALDQARDDLERLSREQRSNLYWLLIERTGISPYLRDVFRQQRERLAEVEAED